MILYHFTPAHTLQGIMNKGLRLGVVPWNQVNGKIGFQRGFQWLTTNHEFGQEWCVKMDARLPFRRDEFRITINVPKLAEKGLVSWRQLANSNNPQSREYIESFPEHRDWWLFRGPIPQPWFLAVDKNKTPRLIKVDEIAGQ